MKYIAYKRHNTTRIIILLIENNQFSKMTASITMKIEYKLGHKSIRSFSIMDLDWAIKIKSSQRYLCFYAKTLFKE